MIIVLTKGYKAFRENMTNNYGLVFEIGKIYIEQGYPQYGPKGNGYHFCKKIEDTLRYYDGLKENIIIAEVSAFGPLCEYYDDYNGYYDMYSTTNLKIERIVPREEIINFYLNANVFRVERFIQGYHLTSKEIVLYKEKYQNESSILKAIAYYQENNLHAYDIKKLVRKNDTNEK